MEYVVYVHEFPNGKKYIGISGNIKKRFRNGKGYEHQKIINGAIKKYGWKNVKTSILYDHLTKEDAKQKEIELIAKYKTTDRRFGYNQTLGGEGGNGRKVSEANKRKFGAIMSKLHKGVPLSEEHKKKLSIAQKGIKKQYSENGRKRIIESNKNRVYSKETRQKISSNTKRAMQDNNIGTYLSNKWKSEKEIRKAKLRIAMYDRYGVIPQKYNLQNDVIMLCLDKCDYSELF